jgi:hypothetical protein
LKHKHYETDENGWIRHHKQPSLWENPNACREIATPCLTSPPDPYDQGSNHDPQWEIRWAPTVKEGWVDWLAEEECGIEWVK